MRVWAARRPLLKGGSCLERELPAWSRAYFSLLGALAVLCIAAAALWFATSARPDTPPGYLLKDNGGHLALYAADGAGPLAEYDIYTRLLPEQDALALIGGVPVQDEAELQRRLEDYGL